MQDVDVSNVVDELLADLRERDGTAADAPPSEVMRASLDQMRLLVAIEERLNVFLEDPDVLAKFDLTSREALHASVREMVSAARADAR